MIIKCDELVNDAKTAKDRNWLFVCLMNSFTDEALKSGLEKREYDVKLLVNGIEIEPNTLKDLLENVEKHIDTEAMLLMENRFGEATERVRDLQERIGEVFEEAIQKIQNEFHV